MTEYEVYAYIDEGTVTHLKKMIDGVLKLGGSTKTSDDFFDIHLDLPEGAEEKYDPEFSDTGEPWEDLTLEEKLDYCICCSEDDYTLIPELVITSKVPDIPDNLISLLAQAAGAGITYTEAVPVEYEGNGW